MSSTDVDTVYDLAVGQDAAGRLIILAAHQSGIHVSLDKAESWSNVWNDGLATAISLSPDFSSDGLVVAGVMGGIIRSDDAGAFWSFRPFGNPGVLVSSLSVRTYDGRSPLMLAGTVDDGLFRSADGGVHWQASNCGAYLPRITSVLGGDSRLSLVGTDCGLFVSTNDGLTWDDEFAEDLDVEVTALAVEHDLVFMATASDGIYARCIDPGQQWVQLPESIHFGETNSLAAVRCTDGTIAVVAISYTHVQQYQVEHDVRGLSIRLMRSDPLPTAAVTSSLLINGVNVLAATVDDHGTVRLFAIGTDGLSSAKDVWHFPGNWAH